MGYGQIDHVLRPPYYEQLKNYEWVDDFLIVEEVKKEIKFIRTKKEEVIKALSAKESIKSRFKKSFEKYRQRRIEKLAKILMERNLSGDPFIKLEYHIGRDPAMIRVGISLSWEDVEQAIDMMPIGKSDEVLTDTERTERLSDLDKALEDLNAKIKEHTPSGYFIIRDGEVLCDSRDELVKHWFRIQRKCNAACNPQGFELRFASEAEKMAYQKLGVTKVINQARTAPNPAPNGEQWIE